MSYQPFRFLLLSVVVCTLASCSYTSFQSAISSKSQKYEELNKRITDLHHDMHWGSPQKSAAFIAPEFLPTLMSQREAASRSEKITDISVVSIRFDDAKDTADVSILTKYFATPEYVVRVREETEKWAFERFGGGWFLQGIDVVKSKRHGS